MRDYLIAGIAALGCLLYSCNNKRLEASLEARASIEITDAKSKPAVKDEHYGGSFEMISSWDTLKAGGASCNNKAWDNLMRLVGTSRVSEEEALAVLKPDSLVGRLWLGYKGPVVAPFPAFEEEDGFARLLERYEKWRSVIVPLVDENNDEIQSEEEINRAIYKVFYQ